MAQLMLCALAGPALAGIGDSSGPYSPHSNSITHYRPSDDCAWIKQEHLDLTKPEDYEEDYQEEEGDKLGQCHKLESTAQTKGVLELACGKGVTIKGFTQACADTTRHYCNPLCSDYLRKMNNFGDKCWSTVATLAVPKGFPFKFMCDWRTGCGMNEFNGLECTPKPKSFGLTSSFGFKLAFEGTLSKPQYAIAEALGGINMADVEVIMDGVKLPHRRRLATTSYDVTIGAKNAAEADFLAAAVQKPTFISNMAKQCDSCSDFAASDLTAAVTDVPMGGYTVPGFEAAGAVVNFHAWSPMKKGEKWDADPNSKTGQEYLKNIAAISVLSMIMATLVMLVYWIFLCGHNCNCCKRICGCCNQKGAWGGEKVARPLLALMFVVTFIIMCTSTSGAGHFKDGINEVGDVFGKLADIFDKLEAGADKISTASGTMDTVGQLALKPFAENGCINKDAGQLFVDIALIVSTASNDLQGQVGGVADSVRKMQKQITEEGPPMLDAIVLATIVLFVPWTLFGLIGVGLGSRAPKISDCFLNAVAALGLLLMWLIAIMLAVELALGVLLSDFCFNDPLVAMVSLIDQNMDDKTAEVATFFLDCAGGKGNAFNPINGNVNKAILTGETLMTLTKGVAGGSCANATMKMLFMPDTGAIPKCDAALANMQTHVGCESINPLFVSLTHDAICTDAVSGLLSLFNTQVVAGVFMLFTLHYASFVRPYMNTKKATADQAAKVEPVDDVPADAQAQQEAPATPGGPEQPESVEQSVPAPIEQKPAQPATDAASS